jgi:hypothetical protein
MMLILSHIGEALWKLLNFLFDIFLVNKNIEKIYFNEKNDIFYVELII